MATDKLDIVVYGATGFTGAYVARTLAEHKLLKGVSWGVAGRSEEKLRKVLNDISKEVGVDLSKTPIIIADTSKPDSLAAMARRARVVLNAVGPYRLHGPPVVKAAVENGANYVDISGEPAFLESTALEWGEKAREKGVFVIGACGWDSIPCDLGVAHLKRNFNGDLNHVESFVQVKQGEAGYSFNAGTYQSLILGIAGQETDRLGTIRRGLMPTKLPKGPFRPQKKQFFSISSPYLDGWALPFMGSDKSVVQRSEYYNYTVNNERPVLLETYVRISSLFWASLLVIWVMIFAPLAKFAPTRRFLQNHPDLCSFNMFKESGPTREQMEQASFAYWFFGYGWPEKLSSPDEQHQSKPTKKVVTVCEGPDAGYIATSGCVLAAALTLLRNRDQLPKEAGSHTTASAFANSDIYKHLEGFGVRFRVVDEKSEASSSNPRL